MLDSHVFGLNQYNMGGLHLYIYITGHGRRLCCGSQPYSLFEFAAKSLFLYGSFHLAADPDVLFVCSFGDC